MSIIRIKIAKQSYVAQKLSKIISAQVGCKQVEWMALCWVPDTHHWLQSLLTPSPQLKGSSALKLKHTKLLKTI